MPVATGTPDNENGPDVLWQREGGLQTHPYDVMPVCAVVRRELSTENRL